MESGSTGGTRVRSSILPARANMMMKLAIYFFKFCKFLFISQWGKGITMYDK